MGTDLNFKSYGNDLPGKGSLARQTSIYSLTFEELQSTIGSAGKDFGSMNMDELLKNIWSADEIQSMAPTGVQDGGSGALQRQGSLTLPRTLSMKTVDEVWKDIAKEYVEGNADGGGGGRPNQPQRPQTLGEITLEEFLVRAGVVTEDNQLGGSNTGGYFGDLSRSSNANGLGFGLQQMDSNPISHRSDHISLQSSNLPLNVNGVPSNKQPLQHSQTQMQQQLFPQMPLPSGGAQLGSPGMSGGVGIMGLGAGPVAIAINSPGNQISPDGTGKSNGDTSSVSPVPYVFNGDLRGRRCSGTVEKVVERRQKRMIKNRESAARSRARKQAYTMELEAEVAKLKEENEKLKKKQEEILEMQKNQVAEMMNTQQGAKKQCLRRTQSGEW